MSKCAVLYVRNFKRGSYRVAPSTAEGDARTANATTPNAQVTPKPQRPKSPTKEGKLQGKKRNGQAKERIRGLAFLTWKFWELRVWALLGSWDLWRCEVERLTPPPLPSTRRAR